MACSFIVHCAWTRTRTRTSLKSCFLSEDSEIEGRDNSGISIKQVNQFVFKPNVWNLQSISELNADITDKANNSPVSFWELAWVSKRQVSFILRSGLGWLTMFWNMLAFWTSINKDVRLKVLNGWMKNFSQNLSFLKKVTMLTMLK